MGDESGLGSLEDQSEWERCRSYQRMFLALHDKGEDMELVAEALLVIGARYRPKSVRTLTATQAFYEDLAEDEAARPVYMVFTMVARAIDEDVEPCAPPGGGSGVVCQAIRHEFPLAPAGFRKVGKQTGGPDLPSDSAALTPIKLIFDHLSRSDEY
jgi:hypothetical protein